MVSVGDTADVAFTVSIQKGTGGSAAIGIMQAKQENVAATPSNPAILQFVGYSATSAQDEEINHFYFLATGSGTVQVSASAPTVKNPDGIQPEVWSFRVLPRFKVIPPAVTTLPAGRPDTVQFFATDSVRQWTVSGGLPAGMDFAGGRLTGTPLTPGTYSFGVKAVGAYDGAISAQFRTLHQVDSLGVTFVVSAPLAGASISPASVNIAVDSSATLQLLDSFGNALTGATWSTTDQTVATVSSQGKVTAVGPGSTQVTASLAGVNFTGAVNVTRAVGSIALSPGDTAVHGPFPVSFRMRAQLLGPNGGAAPSLPVTWLSSDANGAPVDASGNVTVNKQGVYAITALAGGARGTATVSADSVPINGILTGVATIAGKPAAGVVVSAAHQPDGYTFQTATGSDGSYQFSLITGTYDLSAALTGYTAPTAAVTIVPGKTATQDFAFVQAANSRFAGYATYAGTSTPIANGTVNVDPGGGRPVMSFTTGTDGSFTTTLLGAGSYNISVQPPGQPEGPVQSFVLAANTVQTISISAPGLGRISGIVKQSTGAPAPGATVTFTYPCFIGAPVTITADGNGNFTSP
ncbi:MAG TPA: carboxypeptidase regulatory-like domain-containing protein, partial [Gemmatimonadaceae bacterium]|nr:carboxypeptidase regulatory-like domain-containing protein [Gemmatimonadaceae bacterium]